MPDHAPDHGIDDLHEKLGGRWLARWFGPAVVEPVSLHVDAKRYLCAVEPDYRRQLSPPSIVSLALQGGPMTNDEVQVFAARSHAAGAIALRRWDDAAKDPNLAVADLEAYVPDLAEALELCPSIARAAR